MNFVELCWPGSECRAVCAWTHSLHRRAEDVRSQHSVPQTVQRRTHWITVNIYKVSNWPYNHDKFHCWYFNYRVVEIFCCIRL